MFPFLEIRDHERGLLFRAGNFAGLLQPGRHHVRGRVFGSTRVEIVNVLGTKLVHPLLDLMVKHPAMREAVEVVDLSDTERAVVSRDDRVAFVLGPGRHVLFKEPYALRIERFDATALRFEHSRLDAILEIAKDTGLLAEIPVPAEHDVLVFHDATLVDRVTHGRYVYFTGVGNVRYELVDRREQVLDVAGQEIMTKDKVTLRVNLVVAYKVTDPVKAVTVVAGAAQTLYREAQLELRAAIGTRPIDALLADKESVGAEVRGGLKRRANEYGVAVRNVGLKDIVLPGDMKTILNQVIEAQKQAEANLIRRREETAAARSQANTARLLESNPILARIKELELLQETLAGTKATFVLGRGDLVTQLRSLVSGDRAED